MEKNQDTRDNLTDRVENAEGVSSTPLTEEQAREMAKDAKAGEVTAEGVDLTDKDIIKIQYVIRNSVEAGLQSAAIAAGITMVLSLSAKYIKEKKCFWDYEEDDWKEVLFDIGISGIAGDISASVLNMVGSFSASAVPGVSVILIAAFGIASLIPDYVDGKLTTNEFIVEAEMICFDAASILLTDVLGQTVIPMPALGAAIGSVAGMIATAIIQAIWGDELRDLLVEINKHIETLFEKLKKFFLGIWERLKSIVDFLAYLLDKDFNHALQCSHKRSLNSGHCAFARKEIVFERVKCHV